SATLTCVRMIVLAVFVGTYHQYNGGCIFGKWFDLTDFDDEDEFYDACRALHAPEDDPVFMFQHCGGVPSHLG
ncbi:antirestriction protein ArdA, partial [Pseudomonas aeruginosa]|uniref:antirestriction protein ArdA n=1 Tax=Pseudomonas aeruginosa TaxID=287 RepID=UPI003968443E